MSVTCNPLNDFAVFDGAEQVTLWQSATSAIAIADALRRHEMRGEAEPSGGQYTVRDVTWHLPVAELSTAPSIGAVIVDDEGVRFVVQSIEQATLGARWACRARALSVLAGLPSPVVLQQGTWAKGQSGDLVATWHDVRLNLPARIQAEQTEITIEYDRRLTRVSHRIFVADEITVDHTYRVVSGSDVYRVLGYERPQRIDALGVILALQVSGAAD